MGFLNTLKAITGLKPSLTGKNRLVYRVLYYINNGVGNVRVLPTGIEADGIVERIKSFHITDFIPLSGIDISSGNLSEINKTIIEAVYQKDPSVTEKYYRLRALFGFLTFLSMISISFLLYKMAAKINSYSPSQIISEAIWIICGIYFFLQTLLFYRSRLKHFSMNISFSEAVNKEVKSLKNSVEQPFVTSVIPTYMEEPELLKRTLYSLCLQSYHNMKVVLILGNDVYSEDEEVRINTGQMRKMVAKIIVDLKNQRKLISKHLKEFRETSLHDKESICREYREMEKLFINISGWFMQKAKEFKHDEVKYPIDKYLIRNTFVSGYKYYKRKSFQLIARAKCVESENAISKPDLSTDINIIKEYYTELKGLFRITPEVFMRTKYENVEQERTKAGNLTAYCSLIGQRWVRRKQGNGKYMLVPGKEGKYIRTPEYFASFDSDTIAKPDYILRKIVFLERKENAKVGLIQSPYVVPTPEETNTASASGVHSYWFLPVSVGLTGFNSAFWLGFNGVMRFEAIRKIGFFMTDTIIEDTQNSIKLKMSGYEIITSPEEQCITFSPNNLRALKKQRIRWSCGGLEIARDLLKSIEDKKPGFNGFREKVLAFNYVLGLNTLSIATTALYIVQSPLSQEYYFVEALPFLLYIISYIIMVKSLTLYRWKHMLDGLAANIFLNLYHFAGTAKSIRGLFFKGKSRIFKPTPRTGKKGKSMLEDLEFFGLVFLFIWFGLRLTNQIENQVYYDIFPLYHLVSVVYGFHRFHLRNSVQEKVNKKEKLYRRNIKDTKKRLLLKPNKQSFIRFMRKASVIAGVAILSIAPLNHINDLILLNNIRKEVMLNLYDSKSSKTPLDAFVQAKRLGKGINIGNTYEVPKKGGWKLNLSGNYFEIIKSAGFDTVRIPVGWQYHVSRKKPYTIDEKFFQNIDWVIMTAKKYSLNTVLVYHYNFYELGGIYEDPMENQEVFLSIWEQIAQRYKDCDSSVYYELLNEPHGNLTSKIWNDLSKKTIDEVRKIDPYHTIILTCADWGTAYGLENLELPVDHSNIVYTFHTYTPVLFTHQGVKYAEEQYKSIRNLVWPGPPQNKFELPEKLEEDIPIKEWIEYYNLLPYEYNPGGPGPVLEELDMAFNWGKENNVPLWLGEFGVTTNADSESRVNWTSFITSEAEKRDIPWAYWDFSTSCRVYDPKEKKWDEELLKALIN